MLLSLKPYGFWLMMTCCRGVISIMDFPYGSDRTASWDFDRPPPAPDAPGIRVDPATTVAML
jgi:hypothetical protein